MRRVCAPVIPLVLALCGAAACGSRNEGPAERTAVAPATATPANVSTAPRIVMLGDSLTAGLGLGPDEAYPALIQRALRERGLPYDVVNAGVSGDTSAGGLARLDWALDGHVAVLVVALGGNDGLRGLPVEELRRNLSRVIERAQARGIVVVLAGMEAPPNFGERYTSAFHDVYPSLARTYHVPLIPFLLQGVASVDALNQADGIHPNQQGARIVAENVTAVLEPILEKRTPR